MPPSGAGGSIIFQQITETMSSQGREKDWGRLCNTGASKARIYVQSWHSTMNGFAVKEHSTVRAFQAHLICHYCSSILNIAVLICVFFGGGVRGVCVCVGGGVLPVSTEVFVSAFFWDRHVSGCV